MFKRTDTLTETACVIYDKKRQQYRNELHYNPNFITRLSINEVTGLQVHEILHILLNQSERQGARDEDRWRVATEIAVNDTALQCGFTLPGEHEKELQGILPDEKTKGKTSEEIYDMLPTDRHYKPSCPFVIYDANCDKKGKAIPVGKAFEEKELKGIIAEAASYARMYGNLPAGLERFIDDLLTPKMNWKQLLARYITQLFMADYSIIRPNRRHIADGIYLPGIVKEGIEVVVCVDTSASIAPELLSQFFAEIVSITNSYERVKAHVIVCDADVTGEYDIDRFNLNSIEFRGGGGTSFIPALEKAGREYHPTVCIYLTDGYGAFPDMEPSFPVIWTLSSRDVEVPFGIPIVIE